MNEFYNGGFAPEFNVSMLKETIALVQDYLSETRKEKAKLAGKYIWKQNMKSFSNETLNFYTCVYICINVYIYIYIHIYI